MEEVLRITVEALVENKDAIKIARALAAKEGRKVEVEIK